MNLQLFGIPNCGTCKKALQWLKQAGIEAEFINLKEQPPSEEQIQTWVTALSSKALRNTSGKSYRALPPERSQWTEEQWIAAFSKDAMLIKRPVWVLDGKPILVGFRIPEENLKALLKK